MDRAHWLRALSGLLIPSLAVTGAGCGGGGPSGVPPHPAHALYVLDIDVEGLDRVALNQPVSILLSAPVDPATVRPDTLRIRTGRGFGVQAFGDYRISGERIVFHPRMPSLRNLSDAGLPPRQDVTITLPGRPAPGGLRSRSGLSLRRTVEAHFRTAAEADPDLFTLDGLLDEPPPVVVLSSPPDGAVDVPPDTSVTLVLDRVPLDPRTVHAGSVTLHQVERHGVPEIRRVSGVPVLEQSRDAVRLRFEPLEALEGFSRYELRLDSTVTDLTGRWTVVRSPMAPGDGPGAPLLTFTTGERAPIPHALTLRFDGTDIDENGGPGLDDALTTASFDDAVPGAVAAILTAAGGDGSLGDFHPLKDTTLSSNSAQAREGTFHFRSIVIPEGVTVTLKGSLPASLLSLGPARIDGTLRADGNPGDPGEGNRDAALPEAFGGEGGPGGGKGGSSWTGSDWAWSEGDAGENAAAGGATGGLGGTESNSARGGFGGGGGGGGGAVGDGGDGGDGLYPTRSSWNASGGTGGTGALATPGADDLAQGRTFSTGAAGGAGGGAGGNGHYYPNSKQWMNGAGAGGGGGGALLVCAAGRLDVSGAVAARGGPGGDAGTGAVTDYGGAGGGGGGGGTVALMAADVRLDGAVLDTSGGDGGATSGRGWVGSGGDGGGGHVLIADGDSTVPGIDGAVILPDLLEDTFDPRAGSDDAPSVFTGRWFDTGVRDPVLAAPREQDLVHFVPPGGRLFYELQVAPEDPGRPGRALEDAATGWVPVFDTAGAVPDPVELLRRSDHRFLRLRITFEVPEGSGLDDDLPYVDQVTLRMTW